MSPSPWDPSSNYLNSEKENISPQYASLRLVTHVPHFSPWVKIFPGYLQYECVVFPTLKQYGLALPKVAIKSINQNLTVFYYFSSRIIHS